MKKLRLFIIITLCGICSSTVAKPVSSEEAREVAYKWYSFYACQVCRDFDLDLVYTGQYEGLETFYVFSPGPQGFVIIAADDAAIPVLGYSADSYFDPSLDCPAVKDWLGNYSRQIARINESGIKSEINSAKWEAIRSGNLPAPSRDVMPLLTTTWGQGCYYNAQCPVDANGPCTHVVTGCGPTAMSQIMKYHNFPPNGVGTHTYLHPYYGERSVNFGETEYDWASMPDNLTAHNLAVATIMYHTGVAVNAAYTASNTNSWFDEIKAAFVDYFNYDPDVNSYVRWDVPDLADWKNLLKEELDNARPVFYWGYGPESGHYFVCDGYYESQDNFHFNWGWRGNYDGWYHIGEMVPNGHDYNTYNAIMTNLKPYNPDLIVRITSPKSNSLVEAGQQVMIEAAAMEGNVDILKLSIDGTTIISSDKDTLEYTWTTSAEDAGSHEVKAWLINGNDSVFHRINLNICTDWTKQASGFETPLRAVNYISAVDSNVAWAIVREGIMEWEAPVQEFTRTTDGGNTWTPGNIPGCEGLGAGMIYALSADKAYVTMYQLADTNQAGVYMTDDGGATWTHQSTALFSSYGSFPDCIHFFDEMNGWCMGDPVLQNSAYEFEIYTTTDGGETWTAVPAENKPDPIFEVDQKEYSLLGYSAINDTIWFGTTLGRVYKSVDRGYTYTVTVVEPMSGKWIIPVFRNGSHGLVHDFFTALGEGKICETFDGGETWTEIETTGPVYRADLAYVPGTENTWVNTGGFRHYIGKGASISYDGGHTWTDFPGTCGTMFRNMAWVNEQYGWAGGYNDNDSVGGIFKFCGDFMVGIDDQELPIPDPGFLVSCYPNPAYSTVILDISQIPVQNSQLSIYNIDGQQVLNMCISESSTEINISRLPAGIYFYRLTAGDHASNGKLVVIR